MWIRKWAVAFFALWVLSGCAALSKHVEPPKVALHSLKIKPMSGLDVGVRVELTVENPNAFSLPLRRVDYALSLANQQLVTGSSEHSVTVPAGGKKTVALDMSTNLINSLLLANQLMSASADSSQTIPYALDGSLDMGLLLPNIPLHKSGSINLMTGAIK